MLSVVCAGGAAAADDEYPFELVEVARSDRQWTGVAVSKDGRIFVNYARWGGMIRDRGLAVLSLGGNIVTSWSWVSARSRRMA